MSQGSTKGTVGLTTRRQCGHTFGPVSLQGRFADMAFRVSQFSFTEALADISALSYGSVGVPKK